MKAIQTGNTFRIYDNSMKTYEQLPAQVYLVNFDEQQGFYLTLYQDIKVNEKIYGVHEAKVNKVINAFEQFQRNLGVILSGDKGIGKSLFSKILAQRAIEKGHPIIIVNRYIKGIAEYINSIEQEIGVLFDEFDKTFKNADDRDGLNTSAQAEMLTLFDGVAQGKKLFIVTCNKLKDLNDYLINRPGRFHYHFRFDYPKADEIREYMQDHIAEEYWGEIDNVINFSHKVNLNYDCLRAIAFELSQGETFISAIKDLNIVNLDNEKYNLTLMLENGVKMSRTGLYLDLFQETPVRITFHDDHDEVGVATFIPSETEYDPLLGIVVRQQNIVYEWEDNLDEEYIEKEAIKFIKANQNVKPLYIKITKTRDFDIHYKI